MADGGGQMADGGGRSDDEYGVSLGGCVAGNSSEPMTQAYPDVPAEEDQEPQKAPNKANLESTQTSSPQKIESGSTGPAGRKQSQSRDETEIQGRNETALRGRSIRQGPRLRDRPRGRRAPTPSPAPGGQGRSPPAPRRTPGREHRPAGRSGPRCPDRSAGSRGSAPAPRPE